MASAIIYFANQKLFLVQKLLLPCIRLETQPAKIVQNERQSAGDYATGVRAKVQYTITEKGKPLSNTPVAEKNTGKRTLNGEERPNKINEQNSSTNSQGQLNDTFGLMGHSDTALSA
ncbi:MAG TPA: hypothetical protein VI685_06650, partial [Candidatus Angelobacter sp.]